MRPLNHIEQAFTYSNEVNPLCVAIVLRVRRVPGASRLREGLDALQQRHVLLRCCIVKDRSGYVFRKMDPIIPIPLRPIKRHGPSHWEDVVEGELNARYDASGPLVRLAHVVGDSHESELILVLHHAIMDGVSARLLLHEMLHLVNDRPLPPPLDQDMQVEEHAFPPAYRGSGVVLKLVRFMSGQMWNELAFGLRGIRVHAAASPRNRVLHLSLPAEVSRRISLRIGREGLTLNGAISAALLTAVRTTLHPNSRSSLMRTLSFADIRPGLRPVPDESVLGCMISMLRVTVAIEQNDDLLQVAQRLRREMFAAGRTGDPYLFALVAGRLTRLALRFRLSRMANTAVSFLGKLNLEPSYGDMELLDVHAFITNNVVGPELSGFAKVLFGRIELDLTYLSSEISESTARELLSAIEVSLRKLAA